MADFVEVSARLRRFREAFMSLGIDAFVVRDTSNIAWLTGFEGVFDEEQAHCLLVNRQIAFLHTDSRYSEACKTSAEDAPIEVDDSVCGHADWVATELESLYGFRGLPINVAVEDTLTLRDFRAFEDALYALSFTVDLLPLRDTVLALRGVKSPWEIQRLREAQAITDACFAHIRAYVKPGMTELQIAREMDRFMFDAGADDLAFPTIVATGPHASSPHAQPGSTKVQEGDCIVMDFGAKVAGYCSDMTRCLFVGEPSEKLRRAYETLRRANEGAEAMLRAGVTGAEAHNEALRILEEGGFGGLMGHSLGHGVGMLIHEEPCLSPRNEKPLEAGNVVTVEPGIYVPGEFGMRLEDFGVICDTGYEVFTQSDHSLVIIAS
ncbi:MAG: M24 family metallopeptidase [Eggerthellaceae bacterium]